jgi:glycine/sarcosine N-methyltransferase
LHAWDDSTGPFYTVRFLACTEEADGRWKVKEHHSRYRAITRSALTALVESAGFSDVNWREGERVGFHQPVLTATAS